MEQNRRWLYKLNQARLKYLELKEEQCARERLGLLFGVLLAVGELIFAIYLISANFSVYADSFYPSKDILYCEYVPETSITINSAPIQTDKFKYTQSKISGYSSSWATSHDIFDIADIRVGKVKRFADVATKVVVPPNSIVDFGFFNYNFSGHNINTFEKVVFLSQDKNPSGMDITRVLDVQEYKTGSVGFDFYGVERVRRGKYLSYLKQETIANSSRSNPPKGKILGSYTVKQPLLIKNASIECNFNELGEVEAVSRVVLFNRSEYDLQNILINKEYTYSLSAGETREIVFTKNFGQIYEEELLFKAIEVYDPNEHKECSVYGSNDGDTTDAKTRSILVRRGDSGASANWSAWQPGFSTVPEGKNFCVTQTDYWLYSDDLTCKLPNRCNLELKHEVELANILPSAEFYFDVKIKNLGYGRRDDSIFINVPKYFEYKLENTEYKVAEDGVIRINVGDMPTYTERSVKLYIRVPSKLSLEEAKSTKLFAKYLDCEGELDIAFSLNTELKSALNEDIDCDDLNKNGYFDLMHKISLLGDYTVKSIDIAPQFKTIDDAAIDVAIISSPQDYLLKNESVENGSIEEIQPEFKRSNTYWNISRLKLEGNLKPDEYNFIWRVYLNEKRKVAVRLKLCINGVSLCNEIYKEYVCKERPPLFDLDIEPSVTVLEPIRESTDFERESSTYIGKEKGNVSVNENYNFGRTKVLGASEKLHRFEDTGAALDVLYNIEMRKLMIFSVLALLLSAGTISYFGHKWSI